jgi:flagellar basal-body rod protein FlgC
MSGIVLSTALSGMLTSAQRLNVSANNVANMQSRGPIPATPPTQPVTQSSSMGRQVFQALRLSQQSIGAGGQAGGTLASVQPVTPSYVPQYDPTDPDAGANGMVATPNVDPVRETVDQVQALASYRLNARVMSAGDEMLKSTLDIKT